MAEGDFNPVSMPIDKLCGWWSENNTIGAVIPYRGKIRYDWKQYEYRLRAADNPKNINFLKYVAFLSDPKYRHKRKSAASGYEAQKAKAYQRSLQLSAAGRDIGDLPEIVNPERKESCKKDFRKFCESYFPTTFPLEWSADHIVVISKMENCVLNGGLFALAMPRGSGKSTLSEICAIWSLVYGHRGFVTLVGATESAALEMLDSIKTEFETNDLLLEDFPEVCFPIRQLEGISNRCSGQTYHGERTRITWTSNEVALPTIEGSAASGVVIRVAGITGRVRGMKAKKASGEAIRPEFVIVDDPQTTESANSIEQTRKRIRILSSDILGLAGPGKKISAVMPCTVIRAEDMADQILDRGKHPEWNGERTKLLYKEPVNLKLWEEYSEIRSDALREDGNIDRATEFYLANREEMDKGAEVAWESRYNHDEVSALQHAMNLKLQDEAAFQAEYQNEPLVTDTQTDTMLSVDEICSKLNGIERGIVPLECVRLTMFIDIQKGLLFYCICGWSDDFSGSVIDYGAWPDQNRLRFTLADANPKWDKKFPNAGLEGQIYESLSALTSEQLSREFRREDGAMLRIERVLIDANWGASTDIVYQFCRQRGHGIVMPAHGRYIGAASKPMTEYKKHAGEKLGFNWMIPNVSGKRAIRHVIFDTNFWKSFIHARLTVSMGDAGSLSLFGKSPIRHQLLAEHLTSEYRIRTEGRGRTVDEWRIRVQHLDNHWLDCVAGCAVAASMLGSQLPEWMPLTSPKHKICLSSMADDAPDRPAPYQFVPDAPADTGKKRIRLSELQKNW